MDNKGEYFDGVDIAPRLIRVASSEHSLAKIAADRCSMLNDLLAVIHGDGGRYVSANGYKKSVMEAIRICASQR